MYECILSCLLFNSTSCMFVELLLLYFTSHNRYRQLSIPFQDLLPHTVLIILVENLFLPSHYCSHSSLYPVLLYFLFSSVLFLMNLPVCVFVTFVASAFIYLSSQPLPLHFLFVSLLCLTSFSVSGG